MIKLFKGIVFTLICFSLIACSPLEKGMLEQRENIAEEKAVLSIYIDEGNRDDKIIRVAREFEKEYGIKTVLIKRPSGDAGEAMVKASLATGDMADILVYNSGALFFELDPERYFIDLSDESYINQYKEEYKKTVSIKDKLYGIPLSNASAIGVLYNKDVYKELGLDIPKTWDEFIANSNKIKSNDKTAVLVSYKDNWSAQFLILGSQYAAHVREPQLAQQLMNYQKTLADSKVYLEAFERIKSLYIQDFLNEDYLTTDGYRAIKLLVEGEGVHYFSTTGFLEFVYSEYPEAAGDIGFFPIPGKVEEETGITILMPSSFYVNKYSPNAELAKKWLKYFSAFEKVYPQSLGNEYMSYSVLKDAANHSSSDGVQQVGIYVERERETLGLEFLSPFKGDNLPKLSVQCGTGIISAEEALRSYSENYLKKAKQLGFEE